MHGRGSIHYPNGSRYRGNFKEGKKHGKGEFTSEDGLENRGIWDSDEFAKKSDIRFGEIMPRPRFRDTRRMTSDVHD
jgi:hypothetical protein